MSSAERSTCRSASAAVDRERMWGVWVWDAIVAIPVLDISTSPRH
jgi:hypothetical protein